MLHYTSTGVGQTIVLIHGFCENSTCFNQQVFLLKAHYNIITIDLPGHGQSAELPSFTMEKLADEIYAILQTENIKQCILLGHSMGGYVTLAFAKKYSNMLTGFGLIHSTINADSEERKLKRDQAIQIIQQKGAESYIRNFIPPLYHQHTDPQIIQDRIAQNSSMSQQALTASLQAMKNRADSNFLLQETPLPVGFFIGKYDSIIPEKDMLFQASTVKIGSVHYLQNSAHMSMLEEPTTLTDNILEFAKLCKVMS